MMPFIVQWVSQSRGKKDTQIIKMPAGMLQVQSCDDIILTTEWVDIEDAIQADEPASFIARQLSRYWTQPDEFINLKLLENGSPYQFKVWQELLRIKVGATCSYKELAEKINSAPRAIGGACRANQFPFVIPCHRVVSIKGAGGYAGQTKGWLMNIKLKLLDFERNRLQDAGTSPY